MAKPAVLAVLVAALSARGLLALDITSPAFGPGARLPSRYTCQGSDVSPALAFGGIPKGTRSLALVVEEAGPDWSAEPPFTHWLLYDIPPGTHGLVESGDSQLPQGARAGINSWNRTRWGGPCPASGLHRYVFRLHALDVSLGELRQPNAEALQAAMEGHVLATAELDATFGSEEQP